MCEYIDNLTSDILYRAAIERAELNLVAALGLRISVDGNQFCFLFGDDLQNGVAGFGETAALAAADFSKNWYNFKAKGGL